MCFCLGTLSVYLQINIYGFTSWQKACPLPDDAKWPWSWLLKRMIDWLCALLYSLPNLILHVIADSLLPLLPNIAVKECLTLHPHSAADLIM